MICGEFGTALRFSKKCSSSGSDFLMKNRHLPHLLHAHALRRKVIEEPYAGEWPAKIKFAFRFRTS